MSACKTVHAQSDLCLAGTQQAVSPSPAQSNDKIGDLVQQIVVKQQICRLAFPHDLVPQLQIIVFEAFAGFALEVIFKTILHTAMQPEKQFRSDGSRPSQAASCKSCHAHDEQHWWHAGSQLTDLIELMLQRMPILFCSECVLHAQLTIETCCTRPLTSLSTSPSSTLSSVTSVPHPLACRVTCKAQACTSHVQLSNVQYSKSLNVL